MTYYLKNKGTTLFELLIVITLLMLLLISSFMVISTQLNKAYDAQRKSDLDKMRKNLEIYYGFADQYPHKLPDCGQPLAYKTQIIMNKIPCDPQTKTNYYYQAKTGEPQAYRLYANLKNLNDYSITDIGCVGGCGPECAFNYGVSSSNIGLSKCSYVCSPGGGKLGYCEYYQDTEISQCPKVYYKDSTCKNECNIAANRCLNSSGKKPF